MLINEVAKITGLSIRTLHYYHQIGLVVPSQHHGSSYRIYNLEHLKLLEHIQFFKELGFSLKEIQAMIENKQFNSLAAFELQYRTLLEKRKQLDEQIVRIEQLIKDDKRGGYTMTNINFNLQEYEQEARQKWGNEAVDDSIFRLKHLSEEQQKDLKQQWDNIYSSLAQTMHLPVDSEQTEQHVASYFRLLNNYFGQYDYNAFIGLGQLYVMDERFTLNIDRYAPGLAVYMSEAMASWGSKQL